MPRLGVAEGMSQSELFFAVVANKRRGSEARVGLIVWEEGSFSRSRREVEVARSEVAMHTELRVMLELPQSGRKMFMPSYCMAPRYESLQ